MVVVVVVVMVVVVVVGATFKGMKTSPNESNKMRPNETYTDEFS